MAAEQRQIEWGTAEIDDGTLTVQLAGASSKSWKARFENVLALLDTPHSGWGEVSLTKKAIKVSGVQQGSEAELRHFLESAVLQANTDTAPDAPHRTTRRTRSPTPTSRWPRPSAASPSSPTPLAASSSLFASAASG